MSKCGKGCLPECEYFTTGGCISPFNCMYKEESEYSNSATSGTVIYTGGMNMTNEEMIENLKCVIADIFEQCEQLKAENAALRERLEKAVELPCEVGSTVYSISETDEEDNFNPWIDAGRVVSFSIDVNLWIYVRYNSGLTMWYTKDSFDEEVYITLEEAEARLAELKGGAK